MAKTKRLSDTQAIHIRNLLQDKLDELYGPKDEQNRRSKNGRVTGQRAICERIGITQPVLRDIENASGSIGVHALIALRPFLNETIDDLLLLDPLPQKVEKALLPPPPLEQQEAAELVATAFDALARLRQQHESTPPSPPTKGKSDAPRSRRPVR